MLSTLSFALMLSFGWSPGEPPIPARIQSSGSPSQIAALKKSNQTIPAVQKRQDQGLQPRQSGELLSLGVPFPLGPVPALRSSALEQSSGG